MLDNTLTREHGIDLNIALEEMSYVLRWLEVLELNAIHKKQPPPDFARVLEDLSDHLARALFRMEAACDELPSRKSLDAMRPSDLDSTFDPTSDEGF